MKKLYCIPKLNQIDEFAAFSKEYDAGFEYNDFFLPVILDQPEKVTEIIETYTALDRDRSEDTLHGVFLDICVNSDDPEIFKVSDMRIRQSMDIAMRLGVKAVIFHTNHIPNFRLQSYRDGWLARNCTYWRNLLAEYPTLEIYIENMFDEEPLLLKQLAEALADEPRFGICLDFAHAYISHTPLPEWVTALHPYTRHLHINDNDGIEDTHNPVGQGSLPWNVYRTIFGLMPDDKCPSVLIEVRDFESLAASVKFMKGRMLYPFDNLREWSPLDLLPNMP